MSVGYDRYTNSYSIQKLKICSVILARGGSKGIPDKNIMDINGMPLISYSIKASLNSAVNETWVCTDSDHIAEVSQKCGAKVLMRTQEISTDKSPSEEALLFFANKVEFDIMVFIQATSPLITSEYIDRGIDMVTNGVYNSVFSAYKEHWTPRWRLDGEPYQWDINNRPRRQDKKLLWVENGAFYITSKKDLLESKARYSKKIGIIEMPYSLSFQVDTMDDVKIISRMI